MRYVNSSKNDSSDEKRYMKQGERRHQIIDFILKTLN